MEREQFLELVAKRAGIPLHEAEPRTRAMLRVLRAALSDGEWHEVCRRLPESITAPVAGGAAGGRRC